MRKVMLAVVASALTGCAMSRPSPITLEYAPKEMPAAHADGSQPLWLTVEDRSGGLVFEGRRSAGMKAALLTPLGAALKTALGVEFQRAGIPLTHGGAAKGTLKVVVTRAAVLYEDADYWMTGKLLFTGELSTPEGERRWSFPVEGTGRIQQMYEFSGDPSPRKVLAGALNASVAYFTKQLVLNGLPKLTSAPVPAAAQAPAPAASPVPSPAVRSDVDELPPARPARKAHAVVIGIERYRESLPSADFAAGDARLAAEYFKRLGVPEANVALLTDDRATKSDFEKYFERWLPNRVEAGDEVYVYFSGHGAPNPAKGDAYLVPFDGDPTYIEQTGYPVAKLYAQLSKLPAKRVLVAMDSCFSGAGGRSVIAKGARPLVNVVSAAPPSKVTVMSASAGDQISNSYQEKGHGLFTYFLLKGLKENGADFRAAFDYLKPEVSRIARREYNADQDPQWREGK